jgi:CheY-like chemotaxis protein
MKDLLQSSLGPTVRIETRFPLMMSPVSADANQLEMALLNLVVNARDAMPDGGEIVIATRREDIRAGNINRLKAGPYICLAVSDTGAGMDEVTLNRAMEPFFTTKGPGKGTGLGLSMVHGVTEQFGGRFALKSRIGEGTTAELWLPVAEAKTPERERLPVEVTAVDHGSLVVLAVDDDFLVLTNTIAMLEDLGHTAIPASSAREALDILGREPSIDMVITDQAMPNMTGVELAGIVQRKWPGLMIVLATGYAEMEPGLGRELPKLSKPFNEAQLAREIARLVPPSRRGEVSTH